MHKLPIGLEHLQSGIEFQNSDAIVIERNGPTTFNVFSFKPFSAIWTVVTDCGHIERRRMQSVDTTDSCSTTSWTMGLISEAVRKNYRLRDENPINGMMVSFRTKEAIFIRLPESLRARIDGTCSCEYCKSHPNELPMWDTMVIPAKTPQGNDFAYTVHMPDIKQAIEHWKSKGELVS